jgi:sensor histidine kinase YesM
MLRYLYTLETLIDSKSKVRKHYSSDIIISNLFDENLDEIDFIKSLSELELIYGFEIPEELYDRTDLTLGQFADELSKLPIISDELYSEFFNIKFTSMKLTKRYIELETKTDEESLLEKQMINKKILGLDDRLNVLLGNALVNFKGSCLP